MWAMCCIPFPPELGYSWNPIPYNSVGPLRSRSFYCLNTIFFQVGIYSKIGLNLNILQSVFFFFFKQLIPHPQLVVSISIKQDESEGKSDLVDFLLYSLSITVCINFIDQLIVFTVKVWTWLSHPIEWTVSKEAFFWLTQSLPDLDTSVKNLSWAHAWSFTWDLLHVDSLSLSIHFIAITINVVQTDLK